MMIGVESISVSRNPNSVAKVYFNVSMSGPNVFFLSGQLATSGYQVKILEFFWI